MPPSTKSAGARDRRAVPAERPNAWLIGAAGWLVPGAAHFLQGQVRKSVIFFVTLVAMFAIGIGCGGRLFPFQADDPLVLLAAVAQWMLGLPRLVAGLGGYGAGDLIRASYEYGNTFIIAGGLLNALVVLDAVDGASGSRPR